MTISAELVAIGILGVALVSFGWKFSSDIRRKKFTMFADLRERMARLEGLFEGFDRG